ncbi:hypothetical protein D3C81_677890 [compost metagenome]
MQPATLPQLLAFLWFLEIPHGQPRGSQHQLALSLAICREEIAIAIDDRCLHQRHRDTCLDAVGHAFVVAAGLQFIVQVRGRNQRARLGHAIGCSQLNAPGQRRLIKRAVERTATDYDLPAAEVLALGARTIEQHLQDGRYAVRECDLLVPPELDQHFGLVSARIHLLHAEHGRRVRDAPGMHVKHGRDGHVHIVAAKQAHAVDTAGYRSCRQGVQHQLPVGEIHPFWVPGGASGVESGGDRVLVEIREVVHRAGRRQELLVLTDQVGQVGGFLLAIGQQQGFLDRGQLPGDGLVKADKVAVDQHEAVIGVIHGVEDLLR